MARPRLPKLIKDLQGTSQACREKGGDVNFEELAKVPACPKYFTKTQRRIYKSTCEQMVRLRLLNVVNLPLIASYAREMGIYFDAEEKLSEVYSIIMDTTSDVTGSAYTGTRRTKYDSYEETKALRKVGKDALKSAHALAKEFGFTPTSQGKLNIKGDGEKDELLGMLGL